MQRACWTLMLLASSSVWAADAPTAAVQAADDARVAAMKKPQRDQLESIFSDDLKYVHSNGLVDTKASLIATLMAGKTKYVSYEYESRDVTFPVPSIALMTGRARIKFSSAEGAAEASLSFLGVWRLENGKWRFLAWQSCRLNPPKTS